MASRSVDDLLPEVRDKVLAFVNGCAARGVTIMVYCTHRGPEEQALLYERGRTLPGPVVTKAKSWQSAHQYRRAADCVPMVLGKPLWKYEKNSPEWVIFGEEVEKAGLEWAGKWQRFREYVHVQDLSGKTISQLFIAEVPTEATT